MFDSSIKMVVKSILMLSQEKHKKKNVRLTLQFVTLQVKFITMNSKLSVI